jgi:hypothetical protein
MLCSSVSNTLVRLKMGRAVLALGVRSNIVPLVRDISPVSHKIYIFFKL